MVLEAVDRTHIVITESKFGRESVERGGCKPIKKPGEDKPIRARRHAGPVVVAIVHIGTISVRSAGGVLSVGIDKGRMSQGNAQFWSSTPGHSRFNVVMDRSFEALMLQEVMMQAAE